MSDQNELPEWDELPEDIQQTLIASGFNEDMYDQMRYQALWNIPWADLAAEIRAAFESHGVNEVEFEASRLEKESMGFALSLEPRVIHMNDLKTVLTTGRLLDFNRQVAEEDEENLDPEGTNILRPWLVHRHINGEVSDPHMRVEGYLRMKGSEKAFMAMFDMTMDHFNKCQTVSEFKEERGLPVEEDEGDWGKFLRDFWEIVEESDGPQARHLEIVK